MLFCFVGGHTVGRRFGVFGVVMERHDSRRDVLVL